MDAAPLPSRGDTLPVLKKPVRSSFFNFDFTLLERVRTEFDLVPPLALRPILMDGRTATLMEVRSKTSRKAVVATPERSYFLKEVPWYCDSPEFLTFSQSLQRQLSAAGVPVPSLCQTRGGETWLDFGGHRLTLTHFVSGRRFDGSQPDSRAAGAALATLHTCQRAADLPAYQGDDFLQLIGDHIELIKEERPDVAESLPQGVLPGLRSMLAENAQVLTAHGFHDLPRIAVHGDFNPWNVCFMGVPSRVAGIFDFDNSDRHQRLHDLAEGLVTFSGTVVYRSDSTRFAAVRSDAPSGLATAFLSGYDLSTLTEAEASLLPHVCALIGIEFSCLGLLRSDFLPPAAEELVNWIAELPGLAASWMRLAGQSE